MRALITGIGGQDGAYMTRFLLEKDYQVFGLLPRRSIEDQLWRLRWLGVDTEKITFLSGDITDSGSIIKGLEISEPDEVYNFAAQSFAPASWSQPKLTFDVNTVGVLNLLEAIRGTDQPKLYQASTSEMIGKPLDCHSVQSVKWEPKNPYASAKLAAHDLCNQYRDKYSMFIVSGILFNHESPLRGIEFVTRKVTDGVAKIAAGKAEKLYLGNLLTRRDWGFAGDYVEGIWQMMQQEKAKDYFLGTGQSISIKEWVEMSFLFANLDWKEFVEVKEAFIREKDTLDLVGSYREIEAELGWKPELDVIGLNAQMMNADFKRYGLS